jgi:hypothetical protein
VSDSTNSPDVINQVRAWIDECIVHHETCGQDADSTWKPTRLLDLGDADAQCDPRLIISAKHFNRSSESKQSCYDSQAQRYMTLSHCWGTSPMFKLENRNLVRNETSFCNSIPLGELPKTFKQAVEVTKRLGVRYLWIDSLCIIQDSTEDWRNEASTMSHVYKNSYCTIAATAATDSSVGCFFARSPSIACATIVTPEWKEALGKQFVVAQPHQGLMSKLAKLPLLQRAWVLQERLLSPRVVHFTDEQVYFECHKYLARELYPNGIPDPHGDICKKCVQNYFVHRKIDAEEQIFRGVPEEIIEWNRLLERYTACSLTYGRDKLIALSGIATDFHRTKLPQDQYLAGIWQSQMPAALLWTTAGNVIPQPGEYRAPSWSWASVDNAISMRKTERDGGYFYAELTEFWHAEVEIIDNKQTGQVTGGNVLLFGMAADAHIVPVDQPSGAIMQIATLLRPNSRSGPLHIRYGDWALTANAKFDVPVEEDSDRTVPILFVRYSARAEGSRYDGIVWPSLHGLILEPAGEGTFKRIGTFGIMGERVPEILSYLDYPTAKVIKLV